MIEIKNLKKSPIQLIIKSKVTPKSFTTLVLPGIGGKKNIYLLEDERTTEYINKAENQGLIVTKYIPNNIIKKTKEGK
jgi:hypothetical protein